MRRSSRAPPAPWWAYALVFCAVLALFTARDEEQGCEGRFS